jgi:hypothetical protein
MSRPRIHGKIEQRLKIEEKLAAREDHQAEPMGESGFQKKTWPEMKRCKWHTRRRRGCLRSKYSGAEKGRVFEGSDSAGQLRKFRYSYGNPLLFEKIFSFPNKRLRSDDARHVRPYHPVVGQRVSSPRQWQGEFVRSRFCAVRTRPIRIGEARRGILAESYLSLGYKPYNKLHKSNFSGE